MNEGRDRGDESGSEIWNSSSSWEAQCLEELDRELEPNLDERLPQEKQFATEKLWYSFQNCASAVTTLYKERLSQSNIHLPVWLVFKNAAESVTQLYKDSLDAHKGSLDLGINIGHQRRTRDIVAWVKKRRRHIRREDLLAFLCGKAAPSARMRSAHNVPRSPSERSSPRTISPPREVPRVVEPADDLQPFREALALQGLNGAMANIGVSQSPSTHHSRRRHSSNHDLFPEDLVSHPDTRKRSSGNCGPTGEGSPSHKRSRLL
ncbi:HUWE1-associated protein modifying stress responses-like [Diadema setosum]|uniref:HUWE1-associated protein modifying stress responses-like n=1 Tax=Diadema setosum TaxID=31175 RepID=UPI003B3B3ED7